MRIGVSLASRHGAVDGRDGVARMIERTSAARDAGLDLLSVGDHHLNDTPYYQNAPILGRLLAEWGDARAGCLYLVPLWPAVLMAEQIGTLATVASGSFVVQTGLGGGPAESAGMGVEHRGRAARLEEIIAVVRSLLAGETVTSELLGVTDARISPTPPEPVEWWIGAGADAGIERAARLGDTWYAGPNLDLERARERLGYFLDSCALHDRTPPCLPIRRDVFVSADEHEAERIGEEVVAAGYRGLTSDVVVYGTPEQVAARFAALGEIGFTDVIVRQMAVPPELAVESYHLLGEVRRLLG